MNTLAQLAKSVDSIRDWQRRDVRSTPSTSAACCFGVVLLGLLAVVVAAGAGARRRGRKRHVWPIVDYLSSAGGVSRREPARASRAAISIPAVTGCAPPSTRRAIRSAARASIPPSRRSPCVVKRLSSQQLRVGSYARRPPSLEAPAHRYSVFAMQGARAPVARRVLGEMMIATATASLYFCRRSDEHYSAAAVPHPFTFWRPHDARGSCWIALRVCSVARTCSQ